MPSKKIDAEGNYTDFRGVTVVASVGKNNSELWQNIYNFLNNSAVLKEYFSPLPLESYHMTACTLYNQNSADNFITFISEWLEFFQFVHSTFAEKQFTPQISLEHIITKGVIQLEVLLPEDQANAILDSATQLQLQNKVPKVFHMTLAYQYKYLPEEHALAIQEEIDLLKTICMDYKEAIILDPPQLCSFKSMTKFTPWDGTVNPFVSSYLDKHGIFADANGFPSALTESKIIPAL